MTMRHTGKILIVDDATANLQLLTNLLTEHGYTVHPASDGELALEFVRSTLPDLILLDIRMPGMDGYEVCRRLKADERTRAVPVIFISILEDERDKVKGFQEGAVDYITKPFQPEEVLARVRIHLQLRELTERLEQKVDERTEELTKANQRLQQEIAERRRAEKELTQIQWMLSGKPSSADSRAESDQSYGDLSALNRGGLIARSIDKRVLRGIASEYLDLLETSSAIYEKNGDYAFGIFSSRWCRLMDLASRRLCNTDDNASALASGKWLCHESCWTRCSKQAIETGGAVDIACSGGIRLYSVPVFAGEEVIGAINFGYGDPPKDPEKLRAIAASYALDYEELIREAGSYNTRPAFIIEIAKQRLQVSARLIGILVERTRSEESLALLNFALNNVRDEAYLINEQAGFEYVNERSCRKLGYVRDELLGLNVADVDPDFPSERWPAHWNELKVKRSLLFEGRHRTRDGRIFPVEISANYFEYQGKGYNLALARDITERKRMETELRASEQSLALHVTQTPLGVIEWDLEFKVTKWNPAAERIFGYGRSEALGCHASLIVPEEAREHVDRVWSDLLEQKGGLRSTNENVTKDGRRIYCEWYNTPLVDAGGNVIAVASLVHDVTERKQAEDALRASEAFLRIRETLLNESQRLGQIGSWDWDAVKDSIWWSDEYYRIYGIDPEKPTPNYVEHLKVYTAESAGRLDAAVKRAMETGEPYELDLELAHPTAATRWIVARGEAKRDASGRITGLRGTAQNITERKASEDALRKSQAFIRNILDSVDEGFIVVDREYRIVSANRAFCDFMKLPEDRIVGQPCYRVTHRLDRPCFESGEDCAVKRTFETGEAHTSFHTHELEGGVKQYVEIKSYPITDAGGRVVSAIETVNDVTERRKLEEQLRQAQKMEAIGTLSGGIAHDFNNILTAIMGYANIIKIKMRSDDPQLPSIDQILASSDRAAHLTQGLLAFSRKQVIKPRPVDLNDIVRNVEKLLQRIIGEDITLTTELSGTSLIVMADSVQIEQVLMNFATNARDAMPRGGTLTISTREVDLGEDFVAMHGFGKPGRHALIAVSDTGQGMDEMTREHIFDPFFTTKEPGKGTGLGLAIVYGIVKQHNGNINVYSEPGKGSTFKIYLPLIVTPVEERAAEAAAAPRGGTETVLLAEDDREVRNLTAMTLKEYGYTVIEAVDGEDAVARFKERERDIDLLLLDVIMPRKSGKEAYDAIKAIKADVAALFISGYTADIMYRKGITEEGLECISKPVSPFELLEKIRQILDAKDRTRQKNS